jgi:hypothetical protein
MRHGARGADVSPGACGGSEIGGGGGEERGTRTRAAASAMSAMASLALCFVRRFMPPGRIARTTRFGRERPSALRPHRTTAPSWAKAAQLAREDARFHVERCVLRGLHSLRGGTPGGLVAGEAVRHGGAHVGRRAASPGERSLQHRHDPVDRRAA